MTIALTNRTRRPWWMTPFGREPLGDIFFDRLWPEWKRDAGDEVTAHVDFSEKDGNYYVTAEIPGMKKEDISITLENGYLNIKGKKEDTREEKDANYYLKETRSGSFSRSFRLPGKVVEDKVDASYKDGVLTVVLPHLEEDATKKIDIH